MKIVFLSPASQGGGAEAALLELLRAVREVRPAWELRVIAAEEGPLLEKLRRQSVEWELLPFPPALRSFGENRQGSGAPGGAPLARIARGVGWLAAGSGALLYRRQLGKRLRQIRPDILHTNGMKMHLLGALAKPAGTHLVWHLHDYLGARPTMHRLLRRLASRCRLVVANSESVAADARGVLPETLPVRAVHNAIDLEAFTPGGTTLDLDALAGMPPAPEHTVRVGLVATFAFWKGHEVFLRAAAQLKAGDRQPPTRFYVIGGPVYATGGSQYTVERLRLIARELGVEDWVGFTGFVEDVPAAMRALDVVVHASTEPEPFGLVIAQALACGRALVVSAGGGAGELIQPETDALTHPPGHATALAMAIKRLVASPELRSDLGEAAVNARHRFGRQALAATLAPLYEQVCLPASNSVDLHPEYDS